MSSRAALPDLDRLNRGALKALILAQQEEILLQREQLRTKDEQLAWHNPARFLLTALIIRAQCGSPES